MKCIRCILEYLVDIPLTSESMLYAIDGARTAVTTAKGNTLCGQHLLAYLFDNIIAESSIKPPPGAGLGLPEK